MTDGRDSRRVTTVVDGQTFHVVHTRSANQEATPLILNHGWPSSFVDYQRLIPLLTDEFHVVIPSLQGFGSPPRCQGPAGSWRGRRRPTPRS